jgi:GAF domain-containing protein
VASSQQPQPADGTEALERLGRLSLRDLTMQSLLQAVADLAKEVMPGNPEASVSVLINDKPTTAVTTGQLALDCDESQYGRGYGPCLHAASTGEVTEIADARVETRWRDYSRRAAEYGALSSLSMPLPITEGVAGALNIYAREAHAFDEESRSVAARFAPYAGVAVANMFAYQSAYGLADTLQSTMDSRAVIDEAKGMLMERFNLTSDKAFQALARISMESNVRVREVAERFVRTGELPG